jgi:hypothetical protein
MTITLRRAIVGLAAAGSLTLACAAPAFAGAGPMNAPTAFKGVFDCTNLDGGTPSGVTGNYVVNAGNSSQQTWNPGFVLSFTTGLTGRAVFIQNAQAFSAADTPTVVKGSATPGPWQCSLYSPTEAPGNLIGTVWVNS